MTTIYYIIDQKNNIMHTKLYTWYPIQWFCYNSRSGRRFGRPKCGGSVPLIPTMWPTAHPLRHPLQGWGPQCHGVGQLSFRSRAWQEVSTVQVRHCPQPAPFSPFSVTVLDGPSWAGDDVTVTSRWIWKPWKDVHKGNPDPPGLGRLSQTSLFLSPSTFSFSLCSVEFLRLIVVFQISAIQRATFVANVA